MAPTKPGALRYKMVNHQEKQENHQSTQESLILYYVVGGGSMMCLFVSGMMLIYAEIRRGGVLDNPFMHFLSGISMEIYLSHMVIFRVLEKLHLNTVLGNGWLQYIVTVIAVICGATVFAVVMKKIIKVVEIRRAGRRIAVRG